MTLLTVDEFREFVTTDLSDDALQVLLDAAEESISGVLATLDYNGDRVEIRNGGSTIIFLSRRSASIVSIVETIGDTETELETDDWLLRSDGVSVERLNNGTNLPTWWNWGVPGAWGGRVTVTYTPADDLAERKRVQVGLVKLDLDQQAAAIGTGFRIGEYSENGAAANASQSYRESREELLASLVPYAWSFA